MQIFAYMYIPMKAKADKSVMLQISELMKVIAHPERLNILMLLSIKGNERLHVKSIHEMLGLTQPETSRHLTHLKNKEVLGSAKAGSSTFYYLNNDNVMVGCIINCIKQKINQQK